jgi:hypothetical protein
VDRGNTLPEYAALLVVLSLLVAAAAHGALEHLPGELRGAVHRALGGAPGTRPVDEDTNSGNGTATTGHRSAPEGSWRLDPAAAAEAVLRCARAGALPDPVARTDCALSLLGLLDAEVLEATVLRLEGEDLHQLFLSPSFAASGAARAAVRLLWEHAAEETLRRLSRTRTFGFLEPFLESPHHDWVLTFVDVGSDHVHGTIERNTASPRRTTRHPPVPDEDDPQNPRVPCPRRSREDPQKRGPGRVDPVDAAPLRPRRAALLPRRAAELARLPPDGAGLPGRGRQRMGRGPARRG